MVLHLKDTGKPTTCLLVVACGDISHTGYAAVRYYCATISFIHNHVGEEGRGGFDYGAVLLLQHSWETGIVAPCSFFQSLEMGIQPASISAADGILLFSWVCTLRLFSGYVSNMISSLVVDGCADGMLNEWYEVVMGIMLNISGIGWPHHMHQDLYKEVLWALRDAQKHENVSILLLYMVRKWWGFSLVFKSKKSISCQNLGMIGLKVLVWRWWNICLAHLTAPRDSLSHSRTFTVLFSND